ncbi:hypothetical protein INS49_011994 [Diaporthe citri]|uniref:uncharacterized protein n=1 Tax=Diaporthe citri TaxID=83186 RepID=UPI001C7F45D7|nr:uncharacterized protein INS49_011994 [Diaporthe citri]KAG6360926.1 hypothetical protein INS49_011994 [Diaporthe citri]
MVNGKSGGRIRSSVDQIPPGLLRLTDFGLLTTSSQPEIRSGEPKYINPEHFYSRFARPGSPLPKEQLAYLQGQLRRIETEFSPEQLKDNDMAVLLTVRAREQEHLDILGTYRGNEIVDSGNPGTHNIVYLYERAIEQVQEDVAAYERLISMCWRQDRQRQYVHFLIPTIHPSIPLEAVIRFVERLRNHKDIVVAFQYEMNGEGPQRQPPAIRNQDPAALELFRKIHDYSSATCGDESFWWPVTESREATSADALLSSEWSDHTHLGLDNEEHIQGMLSGHFNKEAYPAGVAVDPVAVLVGMKEWESNIDLLALVEGILQEEGFEDLF